MIIAVDTETTGLDYVHGCRPFIVTAYDENEVEHLWQFEVDPFTRKVHYTEEIFTIREMINDNTVIYHNTLFDVSMLYLIGVVDSDYLRTGRYEDTLIASHVCANLDLHGLKHLGLKYLDLLDDDERDLKTAVNAARREAKKLGMRRAEEGEPTMPAAKDSLTGADYWLPAAVAQHQQYEYDHPWHYIAGTYGVNDVIRTLGLWWLFSDVMEEEGLTELYDRRKALLPVVWDMQRRGVTVMPQAMREVHKEYMDLANGYEHMAKTIVGDPKVNIESHDQLREILYTTLELPINHWTPKHRPATHATALMEAMESPDSPQEARDFLLNVLLAKKHRKAARDLESYQKHAIGNMLFYNLNITGTQTTRFSSSYPNTQNISKGENPLQDFIENPLTMRRVFGPAEGRVWYAIDYAQLQLFIFAYLADERTLIDALERGMDAHDFVARKIFGIDDDNTPSKGQRRIAKNVNFGFIFGASPKRIEQTAGRPGLWDHVTRIFPSAHEYIKETIKAVKEDGFVELLDGYRLSVPKDAPYSAVNYEVQGTEGRIVQEAMISVDDYLREHYPDAFITLMIHDELVIDAPIDMPPHHVATIQQLMADAGNAFDMQLSTSCDLITDNLAGGIEWDPTTAMAASTV